MILNIRLFGGSDIDVLREIKHDNPDLKLIIFNGYPHPQYRCKGMAEGAGAFRDKSNSFEELEPFVQHLREELLREISRDAA